MNLDQFKQRLLAEERQVSARIERARASVREPGDGTAHDTGDDSMADELRAEAYQEADTDRVLLEQVRAALGRIDAGTFGLCLVDGGPIEAARLEALPWTPYCVKHERLHDAADPPRTPTL